MKVLLVLDTLATGGTERQMEALVRHWPSNHEIEVLTFEASVPQRERWARFTTVHHIDRSTRTGWSLPFAVRSLARERDCEVVLAAHRFSGLLAKSARLVGMRQPVVCSFRGWHPWGLRQKLMYDVLDVAMTPLAAGLIANARPIQAELRRRNLFRTPVHYVPNGVAIANVPAGTRERTRESLGLDANDIVIVSVGRLVEVKDPCAAVRVLAELHSTSSRFHLLWVGDGPMIQELRDEAKRLSVSAAVHLVGESDDPAAFLAAGEVFISTSVWENTSNAILEAMTQSLPVVARRVGGNPDVILDGQSGILCDPVSERRLAEAVSALANDDERRSAMGERGRQRALDEFTIEAMIARHVRILEESLGSP